MLTSGPILPNSLCSGVLYTYHRAVINVATSQKHYMILPVVCCLYLTPTSTIYIFMATPEFHNE